MKRNFIIKEVGTSRPLIREFIAFPKRLYKGVTQWVPWFDNDVKDLIKKKHPYFHHAEGDFFLLCEDGRTLARCCVTKNERYNKEHGTNFAQFYFFDAVDDQEAANYLFNHLSSWAKDRGLSDLAGPMLQGGASGSGILIKGYKHRAAMNMMPYNYPYYPKLLENARFTKYVDLNSMNLDPGKIDIPPRVESVAEKVLKRGRFKVLRFRNKGEVKKIADKMKYLYNMTLGDHLEDYPMTEEELEQVKNDLMIVIDPQLIKILTYDDEVVGYLLSFPDMSGPMQKNRGKLGPIKILRLLRGAKNRQKIFFNGVGIHDKYQRLGGNALLYSELAKSVKEMGFETAEFVQISEKTELMLRDVETLGGDIYKVHRMYQRPITEAS